IKDIIVEKICLNDSKSINNDGVGELIFNEKLSDANNSLNNICINTKKLHHIHGCIVSATLKNSKWWPAMIVNSYSCGFPAPKSNSVWVYWYGAKCVSQVNFLTKIKSFIDQFSSSNFAKYTKQIKNAIVYAYIDLFLRHGNSLESLSSLEKYDYVKNLVQTQTLDNLAEFCCSHISGNKISIPTEHCLHSISKIIQNESSERSNSLHSFQSFEGSSNCHSLSNEIDSTTDSDININDSQQNSLNRIEFLEKRLPIHEVCISCWTKNDLSIDHPFFYGSLCTKCKDYFLQIVFIIGDEDGCYSFCAICGEGGKLVICGNRECNRVYCYNCMKNFYTSDQIREILDDDDWFCEL
ncbi:MAG: DNA (cytosine-5)-methyltransferase 3A, partial [Paramarteilia canceri]